jgi:hypothetical protein
MLSNNKLKGLSDQTSLCLTPTKQLMMMMMTMMAYDDGCNDG